jgi:putative phosphoesterase
VDSPPFIGVVSDTHGRYDPLLEDLFAGAERIVHAGDIGTGVLERLGLLAPVTAVLGNTDLPEMLPGVPQEAVVEALGLRILVGHIRDGLLRFRDPVAEGLDLVISGHSHRAAVEWRQGTLLLNPGSAGSARFGLPRSVALVTLAGGRPQPRIVPLE